MVECDAVLLRVDQIVVLVRIVRDEAVCSHKPMGDAEEMISLQSSGAAADSAPVSTTQIFPSRLFSANCL